MKPRLLLGLLAASLLAVLALAPAASAAAKVELSAEVLAANPGKTYSCPYPSKIKVFDHGRVAGVIKVKRCAATGTGTFYNGSANLTLGSLTGPASFGVAFHPVPPKFTEPKSGSGSLYKGEEHERLRVKGPDLPSEVGAQFQLVLYT